MSWLDAVLAVPTIGVGINLPFKVNANKGAYCSSLFDFLDSKGKPQLLDVQSPPGALAAKVSGYTVTLTSDRLTAAFSYEITQRKTRQGFPTLPLPAMRPYSELLAESRTYLLEASKSLVQAGGTTFNLIGIVAAVALDIESLPPGVDKFVQYLGKLWDGLIEIDIKKLTSKIVENESFIERCHHVFNFKYDKPEEGFEFKMDWQRVYKENVSLTSRTLIQKFDECLEAFSIYSERFGEGSLNYD